MVQQDPSFPSSADNVPDFDDWADLYVRLGAFNHPSELHGLLSGRLAGGQPLSDLGVDFVVDHLGIDLEVTELGTLQQMIAASAREACEGLRSSDLSFVLLLPDDHYPLEQRVEALAAWVQGFLEGLALSLGPTLTRSGADSQDLLQDLVAIAQVERNTDASDEGESDLMEILEYVRMAALSLFADFNRPANTAPTVH